LAGISRRLPFRLPLLPLPLVMPMPTSLKRIVAAVHFATVKLSPACFEADALFVRVPCYGGEVFGFVHVQIY